MDLATAFALVVVVSGVGHTLAGELQYAPIRNVRTGLARSGLRGPVHRMRPVRRGGETIHSNAVLRLLINRPKQELVPQHAPWRAC